MQQEVLEKDTESHKDSIKADPLLKDMESVNPDSTLISIAILNHKVNIDSINNLIYLLKAKYKYFEILMINPIFIGLPPPPPVINADSKEQLDFTLLQHTNPHIRILDVKTLDSTIYYQVFLQNCIGDYLVFIDIDLHSINDCLVMLDIALHHDIVIGVMVTKKQGMLDYVLSTLFYVSFKLLSRWNVHPDYSDFCVMNRNVIHFLAKQDIKLIRIAQLDESFKKYEYPFTPIARSNSRNFLDSLNLGIDIIFQSSYKLLRIATLASLAMAISNLLYTLHILASFIFAKNIASGWTSSSLYMTITQCALFLILAIFGEYMRIILLRFKQQDAYEIIDEKSNVFIYTKEHNVKDS